MENSVYRTHGKKSKYWDDSKDANVRFVPKFDHRTVQTLTLFRYMIIIRLNAMADFQAGYIEK